jgi:tetratricopeptide (TPR) repeat protein
MSCCPAIAISAFVMVGGAAMRPALSAATDAERRICADRNEDAARKVTSCTIVLNDPSDPSLHASAFHQRGMSYFRLKNFDRAIADYDAAIELNPKFTLAYGARSLAYCTKGDHDRGIEDADQAIRIEPQSAEMHMLRGNCNNEKGAWGQALADFTESIKLNPNDYRAYNFRGEI